MVFYFSTNAHKEGEDAWLIYMGKDKHENEDLIRHGWPVDVWYAAIILVQLLIAHQASNGTSEYVAMVLGRQVPA